MPRITCRTPSTRPLLISLASVGTSFTTVAEAPDFSVPDTQQIYPARDPGDAARGIRPGEVFVLTPVKARNKTESTVWIEAQILRENGTAVLLERIAVPAGDTAQIVTQGLSLLKRTAAGANGDRLQVRSETAGAFDVFGGAQERPSAEHIGVVT
jgi:hypothetical protein